MYPHIRVLTTLVVGLFAVVTTTLSQSVVVTRISTTAYPQIEARAYGVSASGALENLDGLTVTVTDNGAAVVAGVNCDPPNQGVPTTLLLAIDVSSSTALGSPSAFDMQKAAARAAERVVAGAADEVGVISYDQRAFLVLGATQDRARFSSAIDGISVGNGVNARQAFDSIPMGVIPQLVSSARAKAVILMTDGMAQVDVATLRERLTSFRIQLYVMGFRTTLDDGLRELAESTGGAWADGITTTVDAEGIARAFAAQAKQLAACTLTWTAASDCASERLISIRRSSTTIVRSITVPPGTLALLTASTSSLNFGPVAPATRRTLDVSLTARNRPVRVTGITSSNPAFAVTAGGTPPEFTLQPNQSRLLSIEYTAADSATQYGRITVASDACSPVVIHVKSGFANRPQVLTIVEPNGGERWAAGRDTTIRWSGLLPDEVVRIDVSSDNGRNWRSVTEAASGLEYAWSPGPEVGDSMRIRIQQTVLDPSRVRVLQGHSGPVYGTAFTSDGASVVTVSHDRTGRVWDRATGALRFPLNGHGNWVTCVATHPSLPLIATGSYDGTVRLWDAVTGEPKAAVTVVQRVLALDFNPDGKRLAVGLEAGLAEIDIDLLSVVKSVVLPERTTAGPNTVNAVRYNRSGSTLVSGEGNNVVIRNATNLDTIRVLTGHSGLVYGVDITADDATIVSGSADLTLRSWTTATGTQRQVSAPADASWLAVHMRPGGAQFIAANGDGTVRIFEASTLRVLNSLVGSRGLCYAARYDATGLRIATGGTDLLARVYEVDGLRLAEAQSNGMFGISGTLGSSTDTTLGLVYVGSMIDRRINVMRNTSNGPVVVRSVTAVGGNVNEIIIEPLLEPVVVPAGGALSREVIFAPTSPRTSPNPEDKSITVNVVTGTGLLVSTVRATAARPVLTAPPLINFQRRVANTDPVDTVFTIANPGGGAVTVLRVDVVGATADPFEILDPITSFTLNGGQQRQFRVRFHPTSTGRFSAKIFFDVEGAPDAEVFLYGEGAGDATLTTSTSIIFETSPCAPAATTRAIRITNTGNAQLNVFDIVTEGVARSEFTVRNTDGSAVALPFTLAAKATRDFNVVFTPNAGGVRLAAVVIVSDALNALSGVSTISLIARRDSVQFSLSSNDVNFGNVASNSVSQLTASVINSGSTPLRWERGPINLGRFQIVSIVPEVTQPGAASIVTIRFAGGSAGETFESSYTFRDSVCNQQQVMRIRASVKDVIGVTIRPSQVRTVSGTTVSVPVYMTNRQNLDRTTVQSLTATFIVNGTLLVPTGATPVGTLSSDGRTRTFAMDLPIPRGADSLSTTLQFLTAWGNDSISTVDVMDVTVGDTVSVDVSPGSVTFDDICRAGQSSRFFERTGVGAAIVATPQPSTGSATVGVSIVETGTSIVSLVDVTGRTVATIFNGSMAPGRHLLPVDVTHITAGTYWIVLTTPTERHAVRFDISK
jgi:WD40 repeat protein